MSNWFVKFPVSFKNISHNVYVMTAWGFEARHCPTLMNEIKKTKPYTNNEPQAGINIFVVCNKQACSISF